MQVIHDPDTDQPEDELLKKSTTPATTTISQTETNKKKKKKKKKKKAGVDAITAPSGVGDAKASQGSTSPPAESDAPITSTGESAEGDSENAGHDIAMGDAASGRATSAKKRRKKKASGSGGKGGVPICPGGTGSKVAASRGLKGFTDSYVRYEPIVMSGMNYDKVMNSISFCRGKGAILNTCECYSTLLARRPARGVSG